MKYTIEYTRAADKGLEPLPDRTRIRIHARIKALANDPRPRGAKKLQGEDSLYRIRSGDYRIVYQIEDTKLIITIVAIAHRKDVYRTLHINV